MIHTIKLLQAHHRRHIALDKQLIDYGGTQFVPPHIGMEMEDIGKKIDELRNDLRRMKEQLQLTQARYGINCSVNVILDIEDIDNYFKQYPEGEDTLE